MASNIVQAKWKRKEDEEDEEEEEEALSLCDLPITLHDQPINQEQCSRATQEEFNFRSWGPPFSIQPQMCSADEVFFKGQILPLRVSFSSEAGLLATGSQQHYRKQFVRSESLDRVSLSDFRSNSSSRSSSLRSQNSSGSTSSTTTPWTKPRVRNQFHTHPSPKPQLRLSGPAQLPSLGNQGRKSTSAWGIFRLGVVPTPEIGLQDLKVRNRNSVVSRNSSSSSSSNSVKSIKTSNRNKDNHNVFRHLVGKGGGLLSGCDCSLETVQSNNMVMIKGGNGGGKSMSTTESTTHAAKEKVVEWKQKQRQKQGEKVTSRRRTFEWLKNLHASHPDEEALLSNPS